MNGYLLATDVIAETLAPQPAPKVEAWFAWAYDRPKFLSVITAGEMERAIRGVPDARRRSQMVAWWSFAFRGLGSELLLPVTPAVAARWSQTMKIFTKNSNTAPPPPSAPTHGHLSTMKSRSTTACQI